MRQLLRPTGKQPSQAGFQGNMAHNTRATYIGVFCSRLVKDSTFVSIDSSQFIRNLNRLNS